MRAVPRSTGHPCRRVAFALMSETMPTNADLAAAIDRLQKEMQVNQLETRAELVKMSVALTAELGKMHAEMAEHRVRVSGELGDIKSRLGNADRRDRGAPPRSPEAR
jgi:hypothetical protein